MTSQPNRYTSTEEETTQERDDITLLGNGSSVAALFAGATGLTGDVLTAVDGCDDFVDAFIERAGLPSNARAGSLFKCILPRHKEHKPSANLWRNPQGLWIYKDHHRRSGHGSYCLADVYASLVSGSMRRIRPPELARWKLRALVEFGFLPLANVELPELPTVASDAAKAAREGVRLLFAVRRLTEQEDVTPFTSAFAAAWCPIDPSTAAGAITQLRKHGVIVKVGEAGSGRGTMNLYAPGKLR
jgi:hypothetical protein